MSAQVAVLGLGRMGRAIAIRLLDTGYRPTVWNRSPHRADPLVVRGATAAEDVDAAARDADVVITSLSDDDAVAEVLLPGGKPRRTLTGTEVECSTISPDLASRLAEAYPGRFVACPIAGAPATVEQGHAMLIVGGDPQAVSRADGVLRDLSGVRHDAGSDPARPAQVKALNNYLLLGGLALLADAVAAAQRLGFSDDYLRTLLGSAPVVAPGLRNRIDALLGPQREDLFTVALGDKDLGLFEGICASVGVHPALLEAVRERFKAALDGFADADISAIIEPLRAS